MEVEAFRHHYRLSEIGEQYSGIAHVAFIAGIGLVTITVLLLSLENVSKWEWLTVPAAALYANLVEYVGHRFPMHRPVAGLGLVYKRHSRQHHQFFTHQRMQFESTRDYCAVLFPPVLVVFFFGLFGVPFWLLFSALISSNVASLFIATGVAYYLNYELLHFSYHHPRMRQVPVVRTLARLHTTHHDHRLMTRCNFNITYPIGDYLFGTYRRESQDGDIDG